MGADEGAEVKKIQVHRAHQATRHGRVRGYFAFLRHGDGLYYRAPGAGMIRPVLSHAGLKYAGLALSSSSWLVLWARILGLIFGDSFLGELV
jgi:hypothetical protein